MQLVVCRSNWNHHRRAAPSRRNDEVLELLELLNLLPWGVIALPGSGVTGNLVEKAVQLGLPVARGG